MWKEKLSQLARNVCILQSLSRNRSISDENFKALAASNLLFEGWTTAFEGFSLCTMCTKDLVFLIFSFANIEKSQLQGFYLILTCLNIQRGPPFVCLPKK